MKYKLTYSSMDVLMADPVNPTPVAKRTHQLTRMWEGLHGLERSPNPSYDDWKMISDALNMMETLIEMGWASDPDGLINEAVTAMAIAGQRHLNTGAPIRLDGAGIQSVRGLLEDYAQALEELPHRTMIACHRKTEKRVQEILAGKIKVHDVQVTA